MDIDIEATNFNDIEDSELFEMLGIDEDESPVVKEEDKVSGVDFNATVRDRMYNCKPEDVLSILLELRIEFNIDEEDFSNLLDDLNMATIENKLTKVNLLGNPKLHKLENPIEI